MARLTWGLAGERYFETGIDRGVLYVDESFGVAWNGLVAVEENPSGGDARPYYLDGIKYLNLPDLEEFAATIQAFSSPKEFDICDGNASDYSGLFFTQQRRKPFSFCYRTKLGNDVDGVDHGYKLHLVYNALAMPTSQANNTIGDSTEPIVFSWEISTTPKMTNGYRPTAHIVIDSSLVSPSLLSSIEGILYGLVDSSPRLPTPEELVAIFSEEIDFRVNLLETGSYSAEGLAVTLVGDGIFAIDHTRVIDNGDGSFTILEGA